MIRVVHPGSRIRMLTFSHPGSRIQGSKSTQSRIPDPDPQHWKKLIKKAGTKCHKYKKTISRSKFKEILFTINNMRYQNSKNSQYVLYFICTWLKVRRHSHLSQNAGIWTYDSRKIRINAAGMQINLLGSISSILCVYIVHSICENTK